MPTTRTVSYSDTDDATVLEFTTYVAIPEVFLSVRYATEALAINLSKEDALDMAQRIIQRFKAEQND